ncbi:MAG: hypothetical protein JWL77_4145 [Chthonomonadaceae bacterium]|nr:hypothetical protein [Chthonomonadaceae bacterium]
MPQELETLLRDEAAKTGTDTETFIVRALEERLQRSSQPIPAHLSPEETVLLQKINQGLSEAVWREYHRLIAKRRTETLTLEDNARLLQLSDRIEEAHAERLAHLADLARQRQIPLKALMEQLDVKPRKV